jgi:DNA polymerase-1
MQIKPINKEAYQLLHEGTLALMEIEQNGIRINVDYCKNQTKLLERKILRAENKLSDYREIKLWKKLYKEKFNTNSPTQLRDILFKQLKIKPTKTTAKDNNSVDEEVLEQLDLDFTNNILQIRKMKKMKDTYLGNILRETVGEYLHPFFHLHIVPTYRSSCSNINFQNQPRRQKDMMKIIRQAFIPREGHMLGGVDYSGIEVRISACYHKDPNMIKYIEDDSTDMHRDMSMDCYRLKEKQVTKAIRDTTKNDFVFPEFYGDYYVHCASNLWNDIDKLGLELDDGTPLKEHLRDQGIKTYTQFEKHIQNVEDDFWNNRFKVYQQWKNEWIAKYEKNGYLDMLTGFRCSGVLERNKIINYPIQGTAFHCLLWAMPRIQQWYKQEKLASKLVGQIHDELTMDNHEQEQDDILTASYEIMCNKIRDYWDWIIVPLEIEAEFTPVNESWDKKKAYPINILTPF